LLIIDAGEGREVSVRIATNRAGQASLPDSGSQIALGLHRDDTVVLAEQSS
jgi:hypothetical protein